PEDLELPFLSRHGAGEADADIEVPEVGFDGRRGRGRSAQLGAAGIEDYGNHRALVDAGRPRHVYWRAYGGTPVRAVDDDLEVVPVGGGGVGGRGGVGGGPLVRGGAVAGGGPGEGDFGLRQFVGAA